MVQASVATRIAFWEEATRARGGEVAADDQEQEYDDVWLTMGGLQGAEHLAGANFGVAHENADEAQEGADGDDVAAAAAPLYDSSPEPAQYTVEQAVWALVKTAWLGKVHDNTFEAFLKIISKLLPPGNRLPT